MRMTLQDAQPAPLDAMNTVTRLHEEYRAAMRRLAATVNVITCTWQGTWYGMTATAVTSVCGNPASLLVCVNRNASISKPLRSGEGFCVNLLRNTHAELSQAFSGKLRGVERFTVGEWLTDDLGVPYLVDAQANLFCRTDQIVPYRTHDIFISEVRCVRIVGDVAPLVYQDGSYVVTRELMGPLMPTA